MRGGPRPFRQDSSCPGVLRILPPPPSFAYGALTPSGRSFQYRSARPASAPAVHTPARVRAGLGSFPFARRYSGNRCFFLFLRLLRCFSSPGSPRMHMCSACGARALPVRVSPFRRLRIVARVPLPAAFRSLPRLSSAPSAKASALRSFCFFRRPRIALRARLQLFLDFRGLPASFTSQSIS